MYYRSLSENDKKDYNTIAGGLRLLFGTVQTTEDIAYPRLANLKMKSGMTVQNFFEEFMKLQQNLEVTPGFLLGTFINGLASNIKSYVVLRSPKSVTEAFLLAKQAELQLWTQSPKK